MPDDQSAEDFNPYQAPSQVANQSTNSPLGDWLSRSSPSLNKVRSGIGLIFMANIANVATITFLLLGLVMLPLLLLTIPCLLASWILTIAGQLKCLAAPKESGGRGSIYISTVFALLGMTLSIGNKFTAHAMAIDFISILLSTVGVLFFVLFLLQLSKLIGKRPLIFKARLALGALILLMVVTAITTTLGFVSPVQTISIPRVMAFGGSALTFVAIYISLLSDVGTLLRVRRVEREPTFSFPNANN